MKNFLSPDLSFDQRMQAWKNYAAVPAVLDQMKMSGWDATPNPFCVLHGSISEIMKKFKSGKERAVKVNLFCVDSVIHTYQ